MSQTWRFSSNCKLQSIKQVWAAGRLFRDYLNLNLDARVIVVLLTGSRFFSKGKKTLPPSVFPFSLYPNPHLPPYPSLSNPLEANSLGTSRNWRLSLGLCTQCSSSWCLESFLCLALTPPQRHSLFHVLIKSDRSLIEPLLKQLLSDE